MQELQYIVRKSNIPHQKSPLIVLIHGYGSNEEDLFSFESELPQEATVVSVQAPIKIPFGGYAWYSINFDENEKKFSDPEEGKQAVTLLHHFINNCIEKYNIDTQKIFLLGFSQGAILSYAMAFTFPSQIPYVIALSGYFNQDFLVQPATKIDTDFFISHGTVDQVIPIEWARKAPVLLNNLGVSNAYQEYPVGHGVHPKNFYDLKDWIIARL